MVVVWAGGKARDNWQILFSRWPRDPCYEKLLRDIEGSRYANSVEDFRVYLISAVSP